MELDRERLGKARISPCARCGQDYPIAFLRVGVRVSGSVTAGEVQSHTSGKLCEECIAALFQAFTEVMDRKING